MSPPLLFGLVVVGFALVCVVAAQLYPRTRGQAAVEAEQELTGVGPDKGKVGPDAELTG